jgi:cellulose synthase/poly-beta-1,6-N-acetylglucosamine synthase-like glycosyltransferase
MPVRNEARFIQETICQLLSQDYPSDRYEILVADGFSDDSTREIIEKIARQHPQVQLLDNPARRSSAGRNVGFKSGRGDIFLVVDGHCYIPDNQLLNNTVACLEKSGAACLGRPQPLDPPGLTEFQKAVALARASKLGHGGDSLIFGQYEGFASPVSNGATYRREVFEKVGYVDESFDACEDVEFNFRVEQAGLTCYTSPGLTVRYYPRENLRGLMRQMLRYGSGRRKFTKKHPTALTLNQLIPAGFVIGLILFAASGLWTLVFGSFFPVSSLLSQVFSFLSLVYILYLLIMLAESIRIAAKNGWHYFRWLPCIIFTVHFGLGWGFVRQVVRRK